VNELKAKCEQTEKRAQEQRLVEEKKHAEEIQFLKRTNQQLKVGRFLNVFKLNYFLTFGHHVMTFVANLKYRGLQKLVNWMLSGVESVSVSTVNL